MSLSEGEKVQIALQGIKWICDWKSSLLDVVHGRRVYFSGQPPEPGWELPSWLRGAPLLIVRSKNNVAEIVSKGRLVNLWHQTVRFEKHGDKDLLIWSWRRNLCKPEPVEVTVQFMRWVHNFPVQAFIAQCMGNAFEVEETPRALASNDEVIVRAWRWGREMRLKFSPPCDVRRTPIRHFVGGWGIALKPRSAEARQLRLEVRIAPMPRFSIAGVDAVVHPANGAIWLDVGGMPLLGLEGFEGNVSQSVTGMKPNNVWNVHIRESTRMLITAEGKLRSPYRFQAQFRNGWLSLKWSRSSDAKFVQGCHLIVPYQWIGSQFAIVHGRREVHNLNGIPLRLGADMNLGWHPAGTQLLIRLTNTEQISVRLDSPFRIISYRKQGAPPKWLRDLIPFDFRYPRRCREGGGA